MVSEKRPEMVAPRAIAEHFWIPAFRVPRSDTLQPPEWYPKSGSTWSEDPVFGQFNDPVFEPFASSIRDFWMTAMGGVGFWLLFILVV